MTPHELAVSAAATPAKTRLRLGLSFGFADRHEHIEVDSPVGTVVGTADGSVYVGRLDAYVLGCSLGPSFTFGCSPDGQPAIVTLGLNVGVLGGYADGHSSVLGSRVDLHGPAVGTSATLLLLGPLQQIALPSRTTLWGTAFLMGGFEYLATDYSAIEGWVHGLGVKPRGGLMVSTVAGHQLYLYGGASWEDFSEKQTLSDSGITTHSRPRRPWAGLLGASYTHAVDAPWIDNVSLTVEGEVGERTGVVLALRYGFSLPL